MEQHTVETVDWNHNSPLFIYQSKSCVHCRRDCVCDRVLLHCLSGHGLNRRRSDRWDVRLPSIRFHFDERENRENENVCAAICDHFTSKLLCGRITICADFIQWYEGWKALSAIFQTVAQIDTLETQTPVKPHRVHTFGKTRYGSGPDYDSQFRPIH